MKIVKFKNGSYGIRRWSWFYLEYRFLDLFSRQELWWDVKSEWFLHTQSNSLEVVKKKYEEMKPVKDTNFDIGEPI